MPFQQFLSADDQAQIRQALGDVGSGTFGQHDVKLITKVLTPSPHGESPSEAETEHELKGLVLTPEAMVNQGNERSQIDWDLRVMFMRDYLVEEGVYDLLKPETVKRDHEYEVDTLRYRVMKYEWDAQLVDDYLIVFVDLERM